MSLLQKSQSVELSRRTQPFYAKKSSYSLGQQVQIEIDTQREFLDFENSRLVFDLVVTEGDVGATTYNPWVAGQIIENLRVKTLSGQMIGHEIRQYRTAHTMFKELKSNNENEESYESSMEGASGLNIIQNVTTTVQCAHRIDAHIFGLKDYYPAHFHQGLMIEFDIPGTVAELVLVPTNLSAFSVSNPRFICDLVQLKPEIENEMVRLMEEQKLFIDYTEWLEQENAISDGDTSANYDIVGIDGRVKSAFVFTIDATALASATASRYADYGRNALTQYRFRLGSRYLNYAAIQINDGASAGNGQRAAEKNFELLKALDYHNKEAYMTKCGNSSLLTPALLDTNRFVCGVKVDKAMKDVDEVISSQVDKDRNNMRVELTYGAGSGFDPGSAVDGTIYSIVVLDKRLQLLPGSIVRNVRS